MVMPLCPEGPPDLFFYPPRKKVSLWLLLPNEFIVNQLLTLLRCLNEMMFQQNELGEVAYSK